jgi:hypothetical protein
VAGAYAPSIGVTPLHGFGAWPVWLYLSGFSAGEVNVYLAPCCWKPAVTALGRFVWSRVIAAALPAIAPLVSGYAEFAAPGVALMNVNHGGTPPPVTLFQ